MHFLRPILIGLLVLAALGGVAAILAYEAVAVYIARLKNLLAFFDMMDEGPSVVSAPDASAEVSVKDHDGAVHTRVSPRLKGLVTGELGDDPVDAAIRRLKERDPNFNADAFCARALVACKTLQDCATKGNYERAQLFASDGMSASLEIGAALRKAKTAAALPPVGGAELVAVESDRLFDAAHARLTGDEVDEVWTFIRRLGRLTLKTRGAIEGACPGCGAEVKIAQAGRCASCGSWLNSGEYDWVLTKITDGGLWRPPEEGETHAGLDLLGEADPEANLRFIEDRAELAFWRWQSAMARRSPSEVAGVSRADYPDNIPLDAFPSGFPGGVRLEGFDFDGFRMGKDWDEIRFRARWCGLDGWPRGRALSPSEAVLAFSRRVGAKTDLKTGLRSAHCPNCGGPQLKRDTAVCEYCAVPLNDGQKHWLLSGIAPP
jgi:hypothetical protein